MAQPIAATPVLKGKEAAKFLAMVHADEKKPVSLTPTPNLPNTRELVAKLKANGSKHSR